MSKRNKNNNSNEKSARSLVYAEEGVSIYGQVIKPMGAGRFEVLCSDSIRRLCKLRGSLLRRIRISPDDIVLICFRIGEPKKGDIVYKYFLSEVKILKDSREIPENFTDEVDSFNIEFDNI
ncbi:Eukaryotic translation initiation factor 1A [Dictyocoela muelleri]|nr:Eukaryotic translation initiation factor 1A [Dictyocoela muelleri]